MVAADDLVGLMYFWGRAHARQRPFQMDVLRRRSAGRLSELFGPAALRSDILFRSLNCVASCQNSFEALPADHKAWLEAYANGVNDQLRRSLRFTMCHTAIGQRMQPWSPVDSLLVTVSVYFDLSFELPMQRSLRAAMERIPHDVISFLTPVAHRVDAPSAAVRDWLVSANRCADMFDDEGGLPPIGSNAFTLPASRTSNRRAMLVCDTHLQPGLPNTWHRVGLDLSGHRAFGVAIPGLPALIVGANPHLAWGVTNLPGDTLTLLKGPPPVDTVATRREEIRVRGRRKPMRFTARSAGSDCVEYRGGGRDWIRWQALRPCGVDLGIAALWRATSVDQASNIVAASGGPPLTVHLADDSGQTGATLLGKIARRSGLDAHVHFRQNHAPIVSANDVQADNGDLAGQGWNHAPAHRARRIAELLERQSEWSEQDAFALLHDVEVEYLKFYRDLASESLRAVGQTSAAEALDVWNGTFAHDALNADLVLKVRGVMRARLLGGVMTQMRGVAAGFPWRNTEPAFLALLIERDPGLLGAPSGICWHEVVCQCVHRACADRLCSPPVPWSQVCGSRQIKHILAQSPLGRFFSPLELPDKGADDCVAVCTPDVISAVRFVACPGMPEQAIIAMPGGQSENPFSRHYKCAHAAWLNELPMAAVPNASPRPRGINWLRGSPGEYALSPRVKS